MLALLIPKEHFAKLGQVGYRTDLTRFESIWYLDPSDGGDEISLYAEQIVPAADYDDMRSVARARHHLPGHETICEINNGSRWHKKHNMIGILDQPRARSKSSFPNGAGLMERARNYRSTTVASASSSFSSAWKKMQQGRLTRHAISDDFYLERCDANSSRSESVLHYQPGQARPTVWRLTRCDAAEHQIKNDFMVENSLLKDFSRQLVRDNDTLFELNSGANLKEMIRFLHILDKTGTAKTNPYWRKCQDFGELIEELRPAVYWLREYRQTRPLFKQPTEYAGSEWREQARLLWFARWVTREYIWWRHEQSKPKKKKDDQ